MSDTDAAVALQTVTLELQAVTDSYEPITKALLKRYHVIEGSI